MRCTGATLEQGSAGVWSTLADCSTLSLSCVDDSTGARCTNSSSTGGDGGAGCQPFATRCNGARYETCEIITRDWKLDTDCGAASMTCQTTGPQHCVAQMESCTTGLSAMRCSSGVSFICAGTCTKYFDCASNGSVCNEQSGRCVKYETCPQSQTRCAGSNNEMCLTGGYVVQENCS